MSRAVSPDVAQMDLYFKDDPDVLKTYSFNYEKIVAFEQDLHFSGLLGQILFPPCLLLGCMSYFACNKQNIEDRVRAQQPSPATASSTWLSGTPRAAAWSSSSKARSPRRCPSTSSPTATSRSQPARAAAS